MWPFPASKLSTPWTTVLRVRVKNEVLLTVSVCPIIECSSVDDRDGRKEGEKKSSSAPEIFKPEKRFKSVNSTPSKSAWC